MSKRSVGLALVVFASISFGQAVAGVVITGTRVIYPAGQKEVTVKLNNNGGSPVLVQSWIDSGDIKGSPTNSTAPFVMTPPVSRIDPNKGQSLRLMFTGATLPSEKESVFWLNVLEIPPTDKAAPGDNKMYMAFRSRVKLFYRPANLTGKPAEAPAQVKWNVAPAAAGGGYVLKAYNPSAYHVSQATITLVDGSKRYEVAPAMVGPGETRSFQIKGLTSNPSPSSKIEFEAINDYGAYNKTVADLNK
ncbi:fimbria/pilus periplasmic chaperone [Pseudomonas proteolytica]|uniref:fimbria/pilus periplasmic chaperone n=1 Tax=Pseudomonas proteolytica TaxID=219574 RepID=UPI001F04B39A|nr:fimbria/pilus periplasmic chaperone [Pseudomonas proteolytica]